MTSQGAQGVGDDFATTFERMVANIDRAVLGKTHVVRLTLTCLVAGGHVLLEDYPGTGKTMLAPAPTRASSSRPTCCPPT